MGKNENGYVHTEEDLFNLALEECHSEYSAYKYIHTLIMEKKFRGNLIMVDLKLNNEFKNITYPFYLKGNDFK